MRTFFKYSLLHFTLFCLLITANSYAQTFEEGTITLKDGSAKSGLIKAFNYSELSEGVEFKETDNSTSTVYLPEQIESFRISSLGVFESKQLNIDGDDHTVLANLLIDGYADLYFTIFDSRETYLIEKSGGESYILTKKPDELRRRDGVNYYSEDRQYIGILKLAFSECQDLSRSIENTSFSQNSLKKITSKFNKCVAPEQKQTELETERTFSFHPFVKGGLNLSTISFEASGSRSTLEDANFNWTSGVNIGIGTEIILNKVNKNLAISVGLQYMTKKFYEEQQEAKFDFSYMHVPYLAKYTLTNYSAANSFFLELGGSSNFLMDTDNYFTYTYLTNTEQRPVYTEEQLKKHCFSLIIGAGYAYRFSTNNKIMLNIRYDISDDLSYIASTDSRPRSVIFLLGVTF